MARRRGSRKSTFGIGGNLLGTKNLIGTLGGAILAPKVGISPQIGAAAGAYLFGKSGVAGAAVGYFVAPTVLNMIGMGGQSNSGGTILY